jgi:aspartate aminotransferase-like enzyme
VVDAISGLGADELETDKWHVDVAVGGSQKALMLPPGLAFLSVSEKAWKASKSSRLPKYYYDMKKYKKAKDKGDTPFTPAITLTVGLDKALGIIKSRGIDNIIKECGSMADELRKAAAGLGLEIFSRSPSNAVTALKVAHGKDASALVKAMKSRGIVIAGGQAQLKGTIIRIAHMGGITREDLARTIRALTEAVKEI